MNPVPPQTGGFYPLHAAAFHKEDCIGCARLLLAAGARLDVHWVIPLPSPDSPHTAHPQPLPPPPPTPPHHTTPHWQYTMTPLDYARWRNRTALAALLESEALARGLTNATRSDEPN